jgi:hypothetical protein
MDIYIFVFEQRAEVQREAGKGQGFVAEHPYIVQLVNHPASRNSPITAGSTKVQNRVSTNRKL